MSSQITKAKPLKPVVAIRRSAESAILDAALLVLAKDPLASVDMIARKAGVGRATAFRKFPKRVDLVKQAALHAMREITDELERCYKPSDSAQLQIATLFDVLVPAGTKLHFLLSAPELEGSPKFQKACKRLDHTVSAVLRKAIRAGLLNPQHSIDLLGDTFEFVLYGTWTSVEKGNLSPQQASQFALRFFCAGLAPERVLTPPPSALEFTSSLAPAATMLAAATGRKRGK
jgi:TetR/AcrR family transcriptional regulator, mexCD-oprJ operon repressor